MNLKDLCDNASLKLSKGIELIEILEEISDGERKTDTIIEIIKENIQIAFDNIENCRNLITDSE